MNKILKLKKKLSPYWRLMRFHKPIGILLLLWPTLWALWIANDGIPPLKILIIFVLGTVLMRAAGCVINDIADRNFDGKVERTRDRPLAIGEISVKHAIIVFVLLCLLALALVLELNFLSLKLAVIGVLLTLFYPFTKRFMDCPQFILGLAFAWGIPMAFAAIQNQLPSIAWLLFTITLIWILIYDTEYAMVDKQDDLKIGIKSSAILLGNYDREIIALLQLLMLFLLIKLGVFLNLHWIFYGSLIAVAICFIIQLYYFSGRNPKECFSAFLNNQWVGLSIFLGIYSEYYLK